MPDSQLNRDTPESQGISSEAILNFVDALDKNINEPHSFMLLRHGVVIAEGWWSPYAPDRPHVMFSLSKSFTSTAIGLAVQEDQISIDDPVISFFPEDMPEEVSPNLAAMRVRHLLSMSTGHAEDTFGQLKEAQDGNWVKKFLSLPVEYQPGTHFLYNTGATYMLSAILQKVTGQTLLQYLQPRLFEPLGIEGATWESCPRGINMGGIGLSIKTEDIARFGQMYLQKGVWKGKRILSENWVTLATSKHIDNGTNPDSDWNQGYGFQFWRCRYDNYRGDGAFGQYCVVMPEQDAVLAMTSGLVGDMQQPLDLVWQHLLPAFRPGPLPENPEAEQALKGKLGCLALLPPQGMLNAAMAATINGKEFQVEPNPFQVKSVQFNFMPNQVTVTATSAEGNQSVVCGLGTWIEGETSLYSEGRRKVAASAVWQSDNTMVATLRFYETPFYQTVTCQFTEQKVVIDAIANASFGPREAPRLVGNAR